MNTPVAAARGETSLRLPSFPWRIFWIALAVRLAAMTLGHYYRISAFEDHFGFGWEMGRVARSLVTGHGYANPFDHPSGPTAWVTPLYPLLLAGTFRLFGIYSALSAWVILAFNCVLNALMLPAIWEIALRCFNRRIAIWSVWIWEMTLTAFLFSWILVLALRMRNIGNDPGDADPATAKRWAVFGLLWGLATLSSPSISVFLPFCGLWVLAGARPLRRQYPRVALASLLCVGCLVPWMVRNALVFHHFIPMRSNFGAELWAANNPAMKGMLVGSPVALPKEEELFDRMGELEFCQWRGHMAFDRIRHHPGSFLALSLRRFYFMWADIPHAYGRGKAWTEFFRSLNYQFTSIAGGLGMILAIRRRVPGAWLFAMAFFSIPFLYYFTFAEARFRHPLEPLIAILGVYLFQSAEKSWQVRWFRRSTPR